MHTSPVLLNIGFYLSRQLFKFIFVNLTKTHNKVFSSLLFRFSESEKMPAGVSWPRYLRMVGASVLAMFAGAQTVHQYYLPDLVRA